MHKNLVRVTQGHKINWNHLYRTRLDRFMHQTLNYNIWPYPVSVPFNYYPVCETTGTIVIFCPLNGLENIEKFWIGKKIYMYTTNYTFTTNISSDSSTPPPTPTHKKGEKWEILCTTTCRIPLYWCSEWYRDKTQRDKESAKCRAEGESHWTTLRSAGAT